MIRFERKGLEQDLRAYGELDLASRISSLSEEQLEEIGRLASKHIGNTNYLAKILVLGTIEFFEGQMREPIRKRRDLSQYESESKARTRGLIENLKGIFLKKT